jgi:hypothetical protein
MVRFYTTADEAMDLYAEHLRKEYPTHLTPFHQRRAQDREAALAEAMVFWMLKNMGLRPKMNEVVGTGGADFICSQNFGPIFARREPTPESMFIVEATSLDPDAVSRNTSIPNEVPEDITGFHPAPQSRLISARDGILARAFFRQRCAAQPSRQSAFEHKCSTASLLATGAAARHPRRQDRKPRRS